MQSSVAGHLGSFHLWAIVHHAAMNLAVQISVQTSAFSSFEYTPRSGIPGSCGNFSSSFVRTGHGVLHSGCTILYCQQLCTRFNFHLHSHQHILFLSFDNCYPNG